MGSDGDMLHYSPDDHQYELVLLIITRVIPHYRWTQTTERTPCNKYYVILLGATDLANQLNEHDNID